MATKDFLFSVSCAFSLLHIYVVEPQFHVIDISDILRKSILIEALYYLCVILQSIFDAALLQKDFVKLILT